MSMMETLRSFEGNPQNPKMIQIPFTTFLAADLLLQEIDANLLSQDAQAVYQIVRKELADKKDRIRNRMAFTAVIYAQNEEERQAAYENYHMTKRFSI